MTLTTRLATCNKVIEQYQAEAIGLRQALIGKPLTRQHFHSDHEFSGYQRGYQEGTDILTKGEGL